MSSSTLRPESLRPVVRATRRYKAAIVALALLLVGLALVVTPHLLTAIGAIGEVARELGIVVLTTGLVSFIYEFVLRGSFVEEVEGLLRSHSEFGNQGLYGIRPKLPIDKLNERFGNARHEVVILQTWIGNLIPIRESIVSACEKGCRIRILLLSPRSLHAALRGQEYGNTDKEYVGQQVNANLADLRSVKNRFRPGNVEVRLYDGTPIFTIYGSDNHLFVGFYWRQLAAIEGPQLEIEGESVLGQRIWRHFENLWDSGSLVSLSDETSVSDATRPTQRPSVAEPCPATPAPAGH